jgi:hypothetical protein
MVDGNVPFSNYNANHQELDAKKLKKHEDFDFEGSLVLINMCKPDKKPKTYKEARCGGRGGGPTHVMTLASLNRGWGCDGGCGGGRSAWPRDVLYYTCEICNMDYCPNCFHKVETIVVIKKNNVEEDPDVFK